MTNLETKLLHVDSPTNDVTAPLHLSTTFIRNPQSKFSYSRENQPTRELLETSLTLLEPKAVNSLVFSSGVSSLYCIIHAIKPRRIFAHPNGYHGSLSLIKSLGVPLFPLSFDSEPMPGDLYWVECPLNPKGEWTLQYPPWKKSKDWYLVVDGTLLPPPLKFWLDYPIVDAVMHSATKFIGGHSDIMAGVVIFKDNGLYEMVLNSRTLIGAVPGSLETWLMQRSLKTLSIRVTTQSISATKIAKFLSFHKSVKQVYHSQGSPVISILLKGSIAAKAFTTNLKWFANATSLGGVESLVDYRFLVDPSIDPCLVRLSIGLEHTDDLIQDLEQALNRANM